MKLRIPIICFVFSVLIIGVCLFALDEAEQQGRSLLPTFTVSDVHGGQSARN